MSRFNCNDCCLNNTSACRFGANKSKDYSEHCPDLLVEQNVAYEKALDDFIGYAYVKGINFSFMGRIMENGESDVHLRLKTIKDGFLEQLKECETMEYNKKRNHEYLKSNVPCDRLAQYVRDIRLELLEEIENKAQEFIFKHIEEHEVEIVEGNAEALGDLRVWLAEKKVEINTMERSKNENI